MTTHTTHTNPLESVRVLWSAADEQFFRITAELFSPSYAMGAGVLLSVGIRNFYTKGAIPSGGGGSGIAAAVDVAAAGVKALTPGTLVATGVDYVTTEDAEIYATLGGAAATANAQIRIEVDYITYD